MFRNRGSLPNIEFNQGKDNNSNGKSHGFYVPDFTNYSNGYRYVVHYDAKLVITQAAVYAILVYIYKYNVLQDDQIKNLGSFMTNMKV